MARSFAAAAPHGVFPAAGDDRWISIAVFTEQEWKGLIAAMGDPAWVDDPDFASHAARVRNIEALHEKVAAWSVGVDDREEVQIDGIGVGGPDEEPGAVRIPLAHSGDGGDPGGPPRRRRCRDR